MSLCDIFPDDPSCAPAVVEPEPVAEPEPVEDVTEDGGDDDVADGEGAEGEGAEDAEAEEMMESDHTGGWI
jgi:hypothetical protein